MERLQIQVAQLGVDIAPPFHSPERGKDQIHVSPTAAPPGKKRKSATTLRGPKVQALQTTRRHLSRLSTPRLHSFLPFLPLSPLRCTGSRWLRKVESKPKDKAASTWGEAGQVLKNNQKQTRTLYRWRCKNFTHHNPSFCKSQVQVNAKPHQATC